MSKSQLIRYSDRLFHLQTAKLRIFFDMYFVRKAILIMRYKKLLSVIFITY